MRGAVLCTYLSLGLALGTGCGTTTVDIDARTESSAARSTTPRSAAPPRAAERVDAPRQPAVHAVVDEPVEPARLEAEQTEQRAAIAELELELGYTAESAAALGDDFERAMESIEDELDDRRALLAMISGCPEHAETTDECPAFGT